MNFISSLHQRRICLPTCVLNCCCLTFQEQTLETSWPLWKCWISSTQPVQLWQCLSFAFWKGKWWEIVARIPQIPLVSKDNSSISPSIPGLGFIFSWMEDLLSALSRKWNPWTAPWRGKFAIMKQTKRKTGKPIFWEKKTKTFSTTS